MGVNSVSASRQIGKEELFLPHPFTIAYGSIPSKGGMGE